MEITKITKEKCKSMLDEFDRIGECKEYGLYYFVEDNKYIAVANEGGDMFMEEFNDEENCINYLLENPCVFSDGTRWYQ